MEAISGYRRGKIAVKCASWTCNYSEEFICHTNPSIYPVLWPIYDICRSRYRRDGEKIAENWVFIDHPHYLAAQGLDVLRRMRELNRHRL
jgi:hypothetical protein